uniref:Uncharacterized protein n=1 Tax=Anguilla anguilla TaxID=7936 RepID=A0A0E9XQY1_ANGAN
MNPSLHRIFCTSGFEKETTLESVFIVFRKCLLF